MTTHFDESQTERELREALSERARGIRPSSRLDAILREASEPEPSSSRTRWMIGAGVAAAAAVVAGTVWLATDGPRAVGAAAWSVPLAAGSHGADGGPVLPGEAMGELLLSVEHLALVRAGFTAMHGQLPDEPHALLHLLGVDADRRGEGIGAALVEAALAELPGDLPAPGGVPYS